MHSINFKNDSVPDLVSIVIPTRNADKYIAATLDSIGHQTYSRWEVIVIEDGSSGLTEKLVGEFSDKFPGRVLYLQNDKNYGAGHTRNVGFVHASGEYVALLDSDDRWLPDHLDCSVATMHKSGCDIVYSSVQMVEDRTEKILGVWGPGKNEIEEFPQSLFGRNFVTPSASVMRRQVLADVGPWSTSHRYCEDFDFWLRCVEAGKTFHHIAGVHCLYRKNHEGATTQKLCGVTEEVAITTELYIDLAGMSPETCRSYAKKAYLTAARLHREADPTRDPSADPARSGQLLLKVWRMEPTRFDHLLKGLWVSAIEKLRRRKFKSQLPPPTPSRYLANKPMPQKNAA